jgi:hypothetical protein
MHLHLGQEVFIEDSAYPDVTLQAWGYINHHRVGSVEWIAPEIPGDVTDRERLVAVGFNDAFPGGHSCNDTVPRGFGQYITAKHLRPLTYEHTVPNLVIPKCINVSQSGHA